MSGRKLLAFAAVFCMVFFGVGRAHAFDVLGVGTGALLGSDLTDIDDDGIEAFYAPPADLGGFDATFFSSDEPGFQGGEFAFNVFDNLLGPTNDKWCCGTSFPQIVGAEFEDSFRLTHFTVSSANDTPNRDPRVWLIQGSNDGLCWTTIFSQNDPAAALWTNRLEVIRFDEGIDYDEQTEGYSMFRMVTLETGLTAGAFFQIGEIEFFGEEAPPAVDPECTCLDRVAGVSCDFGPDGELELSWTNTCECEEDIEIQIDDGFGPVTVATAPGDATQATVPEAEVPDLGVFFDVIVVNCSGIGTSCTPYKTDLNGMFLPSAFLAYGPFGPDLQQIPCNTTTDELLVNFISPEEITCFVPEEGDEPGWDGLWDPILGTLGAYYGPLGPNGDPVVRAYGGQLPNLDTEFAGDDRTQWMITYLEYTGAQAIAADFCIESDDGVLLVFDGEIIHANQICRAVPAQCAADMVPVTIEPGPHVIAAAAFDRGGGWQLRMTLRVDGFAVVDGDPDWIFHGRNRPPEDEFRDGEYPCVQTQPSIPDVTCVLNDQGGVDVSWSNPGGLTEQIDISVNGLVIDTVALDTESYTVSSGELQGLSVARICVRPIGAIAPACCGVVLDDEIYINCGGPEFVDLDGRVWTEDTQANPSLFLTSPPTNVDVGQIFPDLTFDDNIMDNAFPPEIFVDERWSDGPVEYTIEGLDDNQTYEVHLLFREHCCSDGCLSSNPTTELACDIIEDSLNPPFEGLDGNPANPFTSTTCRVFNVLINDVMFAENFSKNLLASCRSGNLPGAPSYNIGVSLKAEAVEPVDGAIKVLIDDLGVGNPPENASIKALCILPSGARETNCTNQEDDDGDTLVDCDDPDCARNAACQPETDCTNQEDDDGDTLVDCEDPDCGPDPACESGGFVRGDSNADGSRNITDGVFIFSFLFTGGQEPPCKDAADTSDQGSINITSGIYILNHLFLGGPRPPAPFPDCGEDPTPEATELGCELFAPCEA